MTKLAAAILVLLVVFAAMVISAVWSITRYRAIAAREGHRGMRP